MGIDAARISGNWRYSILSNFLTEFLRAARRAVAQRQHRGVGRRSGADGLVKVLAEPNIVAISGQEASFLAGGKIFIPVARANAARGFPTITLEEKEFGVGPEVHAVRARRRTHPPEGGAGGFGARRRPARRSPPIDGVTSVLPSFTTRRAQTSVQLMDGQSLAIAGLIKNNVTET